MVLERGPEPALIESVGVAAQSPDPNGIRGLLGLLIEQVSELARLYVAAARQEVGEGLNQLKAASVLLGLVLALLSVAAMVMVVVLVAILSAAANATTPECSTCDAPA